MVVGVFGAGSSPMKVTRMSSIPMVSEGREARLDEETCVERSRAQSAARPDGRLPDAPSCVDRESRSLLVLYALAGCQEPEALDFEAHLLTCDACFQDLKSLDRVGGLIRESLSAAHVRDRLVQALRGGTPPEA
jgi:hypothetical protein